MHFFDRRPKTEEGEMAKKMSMAEQIHVPGIEEKRKPTRRRRPVRGKTFQVNKMPKSFLKLLDTLNPYPEWPIEKPRTRADCVNMPRPCPFVSCRYHRYVDVNTEKKGSQIKLNFPDVLDYTHLDANRLEDTCILDLAEEGPRTLDEVGELLNLTRERVRQIEARAVKLLYGSEEFRSILKKMHRA
jgi:hypothetical protein